MTSKVIPESTQRFSILGMPVDLLEDYPQCLAERLAQGLGTHVVTLNAEMTMQAQVEPELAAILHQADLVIPDGAGVVLYLRLYGKKIQRCPGIELAETVLHRSVQTASPWTCFFYGGAPGVAAAAAQKWQQQLPNLAIAGTQHGYLSPDEMQKFLPTLQELQPQIIFVGLGVPRQEHWIAQHRHLCPHAIWIGVGGSFDIWSERKSRAPGWLRNNNLEWVYRLYQEPWRWQRMLALPKFAWQSLIVKFM